MEDNRNINVKKKKLLWTAALHCIFLEAITRIIGDRKDVGPKEILEAMRKNGETIHILRAMNAQELTRAHVSSHWQKLKKFLTTKSRRKNKFGRWHEQSHYIWQQHMLIQHQLPSAASSDNNNIINVVAVAQNPIIICDPSPYPRQEAILQAFGDNTTTAVGQDNNSSGHPQAMDYCTSHTNNHLINNQNWFSEFVAAGECDCRLSGFLKDAIITPQGIYGSFIGLSGDEELTRGLEDIRGFQDLDLHKFV